VNKTFRFVITIKSVEMHGSIYDLRLKIYE